MLSEPRNSYSHLAIRNELSRNEDILRKMTDKDSSLLQKGEYYTYLEKIANLEQIIVETSNKIDYRALTLKDSIDGGLKLGNSIEKCWAWLSQLAQMAQLHLKNASTYHVFHASCKEFRTALSSSNVSFSKFVAHKSLRMNLYEIDRKNNLLRDRLGYYLQLCQQAEWLTSQCHRVVPIHLRAERVCQPIKTIFLCNFETLEARIEADEMVLLVDNSDNKEWTIRVRNGAQLRVPAVTCLIPGPDTAAAEMAFNLRDTLYMKWKQELENAQSLIIDLLQSLYNDVVEGNIWVDNECLEGLLQTLTEVELDLTFDLEGAGGTEFMEVLKSTRQFLERPNGHPTQNPDASSLSKQDVFSISKLIGTFKEHVKNCRQLKKQLRRRRPESVPDMPPPSPTQTDVEKMMQRMSLSSNDSSSAFTDVPDDASSLSDRKKKISKLYWNVAECAPDPTEKFVDTAEVPNTMPVTFCEESKERFRSFKNINIDAGSEEGKLKNYSVLYFEVHPDGRTSRSVEVQTEEDEFDFEDTPISMSRARGQHAAPPPTRTQFEETWCQTDVAVKPVVPGREAWAQTTPSDRDDAKIQTDSRDVRETQVIYERKLDEFSMQTQPPNRREVKMQTDSVPKKFSECQTAPKALVDTEVIFGSKSVERNTQTQPPARNEIKLQTDIVATRSAANQTVTSTKRDDMATQTESPAKKFAYSSCQTVPPSIRDVKLQTDAIDKKFFACQTAPKQVSETTVSYQRDSNDRGSQTATVAAQREAAQTQTSKPSLTENSVCFGTVQRRENDSQTNCAYSDMACDPCWFRSEQEVRGVQTALSGKVIEQKPNASVAMQTADIVFDYSTRMIVDGDRAKSVEIVSFCTKFAS